MEKIGLEKRHQIWAQFKDCWPEQYNDRLRICLELGLNYNTLSSFVKGIRNIQDLKLLKIEQWLKAKD